MEKVGALISRLQDQYNHHADESSLLNTALLLVTELQNNRTIEASAGKVSVIMPYKPFEVVVNADDDKDETLNEIVENNIIPQAIKEPEIQQEPTLEKTAKNNLQPEPVQTLAINTLAEEKYNDEIEQVPTLAQQQPKVVYELNETVQGEQSINDKLKQQTVETAGKLQNEPIRDLRKAIGINDKYRFVKELFRNDEAAYERSVKTINSFNILQEAEYWIQREMKYKLGWDDNDSTVKSFYQLVKRRFS